MITVTAPGKLVLFGEHAVVYGYPCIGVAINRRVAVSVSKSLGKDQIVTPGVKNSIFVERALLLFRQKYNFDTPVSISTSSDFSDKLGLGSSSAVTVATTAALSKLFALNLSQKEIFDLSYSAVLSIQKAGSGFDVAAASFGGCLYYEKKGEKIEPVKAETLPLLVIYSGIKADTTTLIDQVRRKYDQDQINTKKLFENIAQIVKRARKSIEDRDWETVGRLMTENHLLLQKLGISTEKLDLLVKTAVLTGAFGAKFSGAGGGDCIIAVVPPEKKQSVEEAVKVVDGEIISLSIAENGVIS